MTFMSQAPPDEWFASPGPGMDAVVSEDRLGHGGDPGPDGVAVEDLLWVIPRFVERTTKQIEFARLLASHLPCVGSLVPGGSTRSATSSSYSPLAGEPVDVLDVLADEPPMASTDEDRVGAQTEPVAPDPAAANVVDTSSDQVDYVTEVAEVPAEGDLAVSGYDSLAASQVVPRLATLAKFDLARILSYEQAHRNRQTIIHRVRQLLEQ